MKKSIATIALFSLVLATTSFTTVETSNDLSNMETTAQDPPIGGVCTNCERKKTDVVQTETSSNITSAKMNSFSTDQQSLGNTKKLD